MKLGLIARSDRSGLANQTENLCKMLRPGRVMHIDSRPFNKGALQDIGRYANFNTFPVVGFPSNLQCLQLLRGMTHVLTCESPYNPMLYPLAKRHGVRSVAQINYEFWEAINYPRTPLPDIILSPSYWHLEELEKHFNAIYLPPPLFPEEYKDIRQDNLSRRGKRRFLVVMGKQAAHDRNGSLTAIEALKYTKAEFELVIKAQHDLPLSIDDERVRIDMSNPKDNSELYRGFDCVILPRRYGGMTLIMNEALMSGLPVIMTDISPNNRILPAEWLVPAHKINEFYTRMVIDIYEADHKSLAKKIEEFVSMSDDDLCAAKTKAIGIALDNYSADNLKPRYKEIFG